MKVPLPRFFSPTPPFELCRTRFFRRGLFYLPPHAGTTSASPPSAHNVLRFLAMCESSCSFSTPLSDQDDSEKWLPPLRPAIKSHPPLSPYTKNLFLCSIPLKMHVLFPCRNFPIVEQPFLYRREQMVAPLFFFGMLSLFFFPPTRQLSSTPLSYYLCSGLFSRQVRSFREVEGEFPFLCPPKSFRGPLFSTRAIYRALAPFLGCAEQLSRVAKVIPSFSLFVAPFSSFSLQTPHPSLHLFCSS